MSRNKLSKSWKEASEKLLLGREIVEVRYLTDLEIEDLGWYGGSLVISLKGKDGSIVTVYPSADDEGNGPGALFTDDEELPIIPVC